MTMLATGMQLASMGDLPCTSWTFSFGLDWRNWLAES